jgi:general stress protein YciG
VGETQGKVKEGRWNEEQTNPKNIPPQESEIGIGGGQKDSPFNVPRGNAYKHYREGAVDWIAPFPGIDKNANEEISDCGNNGGEGMDIQFIHPSRRRGGDGCHSCNFC